MKPCYIKSIRKELPYKILSGQAALKELLWQKVSWKGLFSIGASKASACIVGNYGVSNFVLVKTS